MLAYLLVLALILVVEWLTRPRIEVDVGQHHRSKQPVRLSSGQGVPASTRAWASIRTAAPFQVLSLLYRAGCGAIDSIYGAYRAYRCENLCRDLVENLPLIPADQFYLLEPAVRRLVAEMQQLTEHDSTKAMQSKDALQLLYEMRDAIWNEDAAGAAIDGSHALTALGVRSYRP